MGDATLRDGGKWPGWAKAKLTLQEGKRYDPDLKQVYGKLPHEVYFRLDAAMQAFYRRVKAGEKPGFPRVRPRHNFFTLCYPAMYIKIKENILILPTSARGKTKPYPNVEVKLTEPAPEDFREVAIARDARGSYYASFSYHRREEDMREGQVVAFDMGIDTLAVGVNDQKRVYTIGGFKGGRWYNKQIDKIRSKRYKCKRASRRYKRLSQVYKRVSEQKRNKQRDCLHKASHLIAPKLVERTVVISDLSQRQMAMQERNK